VTSPDPDPRPRDDERDPEELGPHLQSELDELLAGLDGGESAGEANVQEPGDEPASPLPKSRAVSDELDDLGPHLQSQLHELLGEEPAPAQELPEVNPSSLADLAEEWSDPEETADAEQVDFAALESLEDADDAEIMADAQVEAELDAFLAEDEAALIPEDELALDIDSLEALVDSSNGLEDAGADTEYYDDGVIDAVSLDDYDAQRDRGELQDLGFKDDQLGLSWDEETEFAEEFGTVSELQSQLDASEALLREEGAAPEAPQDEPFADEAEAPLEMLSEEATEEAQAAIEDDIVDELFADAPEHGAPAIGAEGDAEALFEDTPIEAALDESDVFQDPEPAFQDQEPAEPAPVEPQAEALGDELFEEAPESHLDDGLDAETFDLDEDLFDFASLESGGGLAADDALDIEEFLEAVGEGESFGSLDGDVVEALAAGDDLQVHASPEVATPDETPAALAELDAELRLAEGDGRAAGKVPAMSKAPAPQGQPVLAGGGRTWAWWLAGVAILVGTNLAVATFLQADRDIARHNLEEARASLVEATAELAERRAADAAFLSDLRTPLALPEADPTSAFAQVHEALEVEDFGLARRRLYALLATVDRRESSEERETIEAHAAFMLADVDRLEADAMGERP